MEQPSSVSVRRLLDQTTTVNLLTGFASLMPDITLALAETNERVYVEVGNGETFPTITLPLLSGDTPLGFLIARGPGVSNPQIRTALSHLHTTLATLIRHALENRALAQETLERYRELNLLYNIGETISTCLDPDEIPRLVLAEAARIIRADSGMVLLKGNQETLSARSGFGDQQGLNALELLSQRCLMQVLKSGKPGIFSTGEWLSDAVSIGTVLCAPLKARERVLGLVVLGRQTGQAIFTAGDEKLLTALAGQAAIAMENALLFADLRRQRDAIAEMKNYMDNIFASIASGVITTDVGDQVTVLNRAAERILAVNASETMGKPYVKALPEVGPRLVELVETVKQQDKSVVGHELRPVLPQRGPAVLQIHISPLKDNHEQTTGIAIVVDDLTERSRLEEQVRLVRRTFERYVSPRVVEQLLSDPSKVQLGGVRQEVTILFADVRGFSAIGEKMPPERLVEVLNQHLTRAAAAVLAEDGTMDKIMGDMVMAIFNAPLPQPDHALRAVRAAIRIQQEIATLHRHIPPELRLNFGVGIATGPAVVGNVGSPQQQNYTVIGDSVNLAARLQSHALPGQILLNPAAYAQIRHQVPVRELGYIQIKGHSEPDLVFAVETGTEVTL